MNRIYKLVFNRRLGRVVVTDEHASSAGKSERGTGVVTSGAGVTQPHLRKIAVAVAGALGVLLLSQTAYAELSCNSSSEAGDNAYCFGNNTTAYGAQAGGGGASGDFVTDFGQAAGFAQTGNNNTNIGQNSGSRVSGVDNVFVGSNAGASAGGISGAVVVGGSGTVGGWPSVAVGGVA